MGKWSKEAKEKMCLRQQGKGNHNYKTGRTLMAEGYVGILLPEHPNSRENYYLEHRYIVEKKIGRYLTKEEVVHHINEIIDDNRIENLYLFNNSKEHSRYHKLLYWGKIKPITKSNLL